MLATIVVGFHGGNVLETEQRATRKDRAGYFIRDWQELRDQVRQRIAQDSQQLQL